MCYWRVVGEWSRMSFFWKRPAWYKQSKHRSDSTVVSNSLTKNVDTMHWRMPRTLFLIKLILFINNSVNYYYYDWVLSKKKPRIIFLSILYQLERRGILRPLRQKAVAVKYSLYYSKIHPSINQSITFSLIRR